jgi:hypothetical protein
MSIPVEIVFTPNWWFRNYGISFAKPFYLDADARIRNDVLMRRALHERFGLGAPPFDPRPVIGSEHVAGGFIVPALLGAEVRFGDGQAPWPVPRNLSREEVLALRKPAIEDAWPMTVLLQQAQVLERDFGYVAGDLNTDGVLNTALLLRGHDLFIDMLEAPEVAGHLFGIAAATQSEVALRVRKLTGTCSVSTNRSIVNVDRATYLHSNCSVQMVSPEMYGACLLPHELCLAARLQPYGIHHCGGNLHLFADAYAEVRPSFVDVGWGSDVSRCRRAFPDAFLNLRLSPVRMLQESAERIRCDAALLLDGAGSQTNVGLCCINMDFGTPDENVLALLELTR